MSHPIDLVLSRGIPKSLQEKWDKLALDTLHAGLDEAYGRVKKWEGVEFGVKQIILTPTELVDLVASILVAIREQVAGSQLTFPHNQAEILVRAWIEEVKHNTTIRFQEAQSL